MRRSWKIIAATAVASLGLTAYSIPAAFSQSPTTFADSPYLQVHLRATLSTHDTAVQRWASVVNHLTFDFNEQNMSGAPIGRSLNQVNQSLVISHGASHVATILEDKSNLYISVNFSSLSKLPGVARNAASLASLNFLLGNRWIELPFSLVAGYIHSTSRLTLTRSTLPVDESFLIKGFMSFVAHVHPGGISESFSTSGSLSKLIDALTSRLSISGTSLAAPSSLPGVYDLSVSATRSQVRSATFQVSVPNAARGPFVLRAFATFAHQDVVVATPKNPLIVTPALIHQLSGGSKSIFGASLG